ncbi:MAG: hypothetical protein JXB13_05945 [Phycisphaerae bacterium]|nr:hypothetical protein [Phycisphaerae bacterium]
MIPYAKADRAGGLVPAGRVVLAVALLAVLLPATAAQAAKLNLLFYGNSFTMGSGSTRSVDALVKDIATAAGQTTPNVVSGAQSGWTLGQHLATNTGIITSSIAPGQTWDYVILQDYSTRPTHIGNLAAHGADFVSMYQAVAAHSPAAKVIGFETWARAPGHEFYTGASPSFPGGPAQMQQELRDGYNLSTGDVNALAGAGTSLVAPVGDAWESTGWSNLHSGDLYHANNRGTLLAALVIYGNIYQDDVSDINLTSVLTSLSMPSAYGAYLADVADQFIVPEPSVALLLVFGSAAMLRRQKGKRHGRRVG